MTIEQALRAMAPADVQAGVRGLAGFFVMLSVALGYRRAREESGFADETRLWAFDVDEVA